MKSVVLIKFALPSLIFILPAAPPAPSDSTALGVFVASSPCDAVSRPLLRIPAAADCEQIKWSLTLYRDAHTHAPTKYKLGFAYGLPKQGTNGLSGGGIKVEREGTWVIVRGAKANPDATVYQLDPGGSQGSVSFLKMDHNLLHLLDRGGSLAVGNAGWSYTLNRAGGLGLNVRPASLPAAPPLRHNSQAASAPAMATDSAVPRRFVGRSPCLDVARELDQAVSADCTKAKWELVLYRDPITLAPTTYKLKGTFYRERVREGRWTIVRGTRTRPDAVVYRLDPDKPREALSLLRADDNILFFLDKEGSLLVGNADFSYTLNGADKALQK